MNFSIRELSFRNDVECNRCLDGAYVTASSLWLLMVILSMA